MHLQILARTHRRTQQTNRSRASCSNRLYPRCKVLNHQPVQAHPSNLAQQQTSNRFSRTQRGRKWATGLRKQATISLQASLHHLSTSSSPLQFCSKYSSHKLVAAVPKVQVAVYPHRSHYSKELLIKRYRHNSLSSRNYSKLVQLEYMRAPTTRTQTIIRITTVITTICSSTNCRQHLNITNNHSSSKRNNICIHRTSRIFRIAATAVS